MTNHFKKTTDMEIDKLYRKWNEEHKYHHAFVSSGDVKSAMEYAYKQGVEEERERTYDLLEHLANDRDRMIKVDVVLRTIGK